MKSLAIIGVLAALVGLSPLASAQASATPPTSTAAATPAKPALTKADRKKLKADQQQLRRDRASGRGISRANDKQTVSADRAQLSSDSGHIVGRKHGGSGRKGVQQ